MIRCVTVVGLALLCAGCTVAAAPEVGVRAAPPGAGLMVHEERLQMDACTRFSSWDYCRQQMWGY